MQSSLWDTPSSPGKYISQLSAGNIHCSNGPSMLRTDDSDDSRNINYSTWSGAIALGNFKTLLLIFH